MDRNEIPGIDEFPLVAFDKLRYCDTDRQGHVNNAVFSSFLETGRVEILYDPDRRLASRDCSFVIASLKIDYLEEISWPGTVLIGTRIGKIGTSSITIEQGLYQDGHCVALAQTVIVQINAGTKKSQALDSSSIEILSKLQK